jgi:hypothetical protein
MGHTMLLVCGYKKNPDSVPRRRRGNLKNLTDFTGREAPEPFLEFGGSRWGGGQKFEYPNGKKNGGIVVYLDIYGKV